MKTIFSPKFRLRSVSLTLAIAITAALPLHAQTEADRWIAGTSGDWSDPSNWFEGVVPPTSGVDVLLQPTIGAGDITSTIDTGWSAGGSVNGLTFLPVPQTTTDTGSFILAPGAGVSSFSIGSGGIQHYGALNALTLDIPILLSANQTWLAQRTTTQWGNVVQRINVTALVNGSNAGIELTLRGGPRTTRSVPNTSMVLSGANGELGGNISRLDLVGGVLQLGNSATDTNFNRIATTTTIASNGGTLTVYRQGSGTEELGALRLESGNFNVIGLDGGSGTSVYRFASFGPRADGTVLRLDSGRNNADQVNFQFADVSGFGAGSNGIIGGWAVARTQQAGWRFLAVPTNTTTMTTIAGTNAADSTELMALGANDNVNLTAASNATYTLTGDLTLHSLRSAVNGASLIDLGGNTLTLNSGGFIASPTGFSNRTDFNNGMLTAGAGNTLYFHQGGENIFNSIRFMSGSIIADNSNAVDVVYAGRVADDSVNFTLNSTSNTYTGRTFINNAGLDMSAHTEVAGNASIFGLVPTTFTADNLVFAGVFFKQGDYTFHANRGIELRGAGMLNHNGNLTINGVISGTGQVLASSAVLTFGGSMSNTYSGDTIVAYGSLGNSPNLRLDLNKQSGAIAVPGDLFISVPSDSPNNSDAMVRLLGPNQIADSSVVTMLRPDNGITSTSTGRAILRLNGFEETIAGLVGLAGTAANVVVENSAAGASTLTLEPGAGRYFSYEGVVQNGGAGSLSVAINGNATGTQVFSGPNTYTGTTTVSAGTLLINGTHTGAGNYSVSNSGTTLGGTGRIAPTGTAGISVASGAIVAPGASIGTLTVDGVDSIGTELLTMNTGAVFEFELNASGGTADRIDFWNYISFGDQLVLNNNAINLSLLGTLTPGNYTVDLFRFYSNNGTTLVDSGITTGLVIGTLGTGIQSASLNYTGETIELNYSVIPEPGTSLLLLLTAAGFLARRRRSRV